MNIYDAWGNYNYYTGKVSDIIRSSALAGFAIIWIFRESNSEDELHFDSWLIWAAVLFVVTLLLDLAQYCVGAKNWYCFSREVDAESEKLKREHKIKAYDEYDFLAPKNINKPAEFFMVVKIFPFLVGFGCILCYLISILT